jgi:hypothetical protein
MIHFSILAKKLYIENFLVENCKRRTPLGRINPFTLFRHLTLVRPVYFFCALEEEGLFVAESFGTLEVEGLLASRFLGGGLNHWRPSILIISIVQN